MLEWPRRSWTSLGCPPAVLIELAFIDNMEDAWLLTNYPDEFARAVACGVTDYEEQKKDE
jgi:N-acetylmuramoyl-L-alanine amidase